MKNFCYWGTLLLFIGVGGCGGEHPHQESTEVESPTPSEASETKASAEALVSITEARVLVLPDAAAVYGVLSSTAEDRLVSLAWVQADGTENEVILHETVDDEGVMRMESRPDGFPLVVGESVALEPGGSHGMIMGNVFAADAETVALRWRFAEAEMIETLAPLERLNAESSEQSHEGHSM